MSTKNLENLRLANNSISKTGKRQIITPKPTSVVGSLPVAQYGNATINIYESSSPNMEDQGSINSSMINFVAGIGTANKNDQVRPDSTVEFSKNFYNESAVISICEKTDPDYYWGSSGWLNNEASFKNSSAIILKADELRFFSRGGIKLVTRVDQQPKEFISLDKKQPQHDIRDPVGIWLVANDEESTSGGFPQPMVKGDNLVNFLNLILNEIEELYGQINSIVKIQSNINTLIANHSHISDFTGSPLIRNTDIATSLEIEKGYLEMMNAINLTNISRRVPNIAGLRKNHLEPSSPNATYINSRFNKTN